MKDTVIYSTPEILLTRENFTESEIKEVPARESEEFHLTFRNKLSWRGKTVFEVIQSFNMYYATLVTINTESFLLFKPLVERMILNMTEDATLKDCREYAGPFKITILRDEEENAFVMSVTLVETFGASKPSGFTESLTFTSKLTNVTNTEDQHVIVPGLSEEMCHLAIMIQTHIANIGQTLIALSHATNYNCWTMYPSSTHPIGTSAYTNPLLKANFIPGRPFV